jgi:hypothetical protein
MTLIQEVGSVKLPSGRPGVLRTERLSMAVDAGLRPAAGIPIHGHYCGPGFPVGGDYSRRPRDPVDAVCRAHDQCYDREGTAACSCERRLLADMARAVTRPGVDAPARAAGLGAITYFSSSPCICRKQVCVNVPSCNWRGCRMRRVCNTVTTPGRGGLAPGCG